MKVMVLAAVLLATATSFAQNQHLNPPELSKANGYTHAIVAGQGKTIYLSGQVALDREGHIVGKGDLKAQTEQVFKNLRAALASAGATFDDVVKLNYYVKNYTPANVTVIREVRDSFVNRQAPTREHASRCRVTSLRRLPNRS